VKRVLVADADPSTVAAVSYLLAAEGFEVAAAGDGVSALAKFHSWCPDVVLLELTLPGLAGLDVCREIRARSYVPVIIVAARDSETDRVVALNLGADDFVSKPFSRAELVARIRARLRRPQMPWPEPPATALDAGPLHLDAASHEVSVAGRLVHLPLREFAVLEVLVRNVGRVVSRQQLVDQIWGSGGRAESSNPLEVHIKRIRARIEPAPHQPRHLLTVRGLGYKFVP
jgi:two-component system, OmpR family, response regulator RegX3